MAEASKGQVIGAVVANFAIMAAKLVAAAGGSSAMLSEAIHSGIDGVNDLLLAKVSKTTSPAQSSKMANDDDEVVAIRAAQSMHFGPETVLVTMDVIFRESRSAGDLMEAVDRMQKKIRDEFPAVKYIYIDPETEAENTPRPSN